MAMAFLDRYEDRQVGDLLAGQDGADLLLSPTTKYSERCIRIEPDSAYPLLPQFPVTACNMPLKHVSFTPGQHQKPQYNQYNLNS